MVSSFGHHLLVRMHVASKRVQMQCFSGPLQMAGRLSRVCYILRKTPARTCKPASLQVVAACDDGGRRPRAPPSTPLPQESAAPQRWSPRAACTEVSTLRSLRGACALPARLALRSADAARDSAGRAALLLRLLFLLPRELERALPRRSMVRSPKTYA